MELPARSGTASRLSTAGPILAMASVAAYVFSLFIPAFTILKPEPDVVTGYVALALGYYSVALVFAGDERLFMCLAWFANVAFVAAHINLFRHRATRGAFYGAVGLVLSGSFSLVEQTRMGGMCTPHHLALDAGYVLWVSSMALVFASAAVTAWRIEGPALVARHRRTALWVITCGAAYIAVGLLLPQGQCALLK